MSGPIKALLLLTTISAAMPCNCRGQHQPESRRLHRPNKIDLVATGAGSPDSLTVWEVTDSLRDPKMRIETTSTRVFQNYDYTAWRLNNVDFVCIADSLGVQRITKADFDGNGLTDMILSVDGQPVVLLDDGADRYRTLPLTVGSGGFDATYPVLYRTGGGHLEIVCYYVPWYRYGAPDKMQLPGAGQDNPKLTADTLVYYKGDFTEKNAYPTDYRIEGIHFNAGCSYGPCGEFDLFIDSGGKAICVTEQRDERADQTDTLTTTIEKYVLEDIYDRLCYIDFPHLLNDYAVNATDEAGCTTTIMYNGGKTKTIRDYGRIGTHGLALLYDQLLALRLSQHWIKIGEPVHR